MSADATGIDPSARPVASKYAVRPGESFARYGKTVGPGEIEAIRGNLPDDEFRETALVTILDAICRIRATALGSAIA